jgi:IclR family acetate operon transcriptional repressor
MASWRPPLKPSSERSGRPDAASRRIVIVDFRIGDMTMDTLVRNAEPGNAAGSGTQSLDTAPDLVDIVARSDQRLTANAIAAISGFPKPTVHRILSALVRRGMLNFDRRDQAYDLGLRFSELAATFSASHRMVALIEDELIRLSALTGDAVSIGVPEADSVRLVGRYAMGIKVNPDVAGAKRSYHASGIGKAALTFSAPEFIHRFLKRVELPALKPHTIVN